MADRLSSVDSRRVNHRDFNTSHKDFLKNLWGRFCRAHFQDVTHVAFFFGVREQTAQYWWDEVHAPAGWVINMAWSAMPAEAARHLRLVADNPAATKIAAPAVDPAPAAAKITAPAAEPLPVRRPERRIA